MLLYTPEQRLTPLDTARPLPPNDMCDLCELRDRAKSVCLRPEIIGTGGVLVIGERPGRDDDSLGKAFSGRTSILLREKVAEWAPGSVAFDHATRCFSGDRELRDKHFDACRSYLVWTVQQVRPSRILCVGGGAVSAVFGRGVAPFSTRRGLGFLADGTPVFMIIHPTAASRNRFVRAWFLKDLKWALTACTPFAPPWSCEYVLVDSAETAAVAEGLCASSGGFSFHCATYGSAYNADFRLLAVSVSPLSSQIAYVWPGEVLTGSVPGHALARGCLMQLLGNRALRKIGHNLKFDVHAVECGLGVSVRGELGDTRLWRKLIDPDAASDLDSMSELVGMGGMKDESVALLDKLRRAKHAPKAQRALDGIVPEELPSRDLCYLFAALPLTVLHRRNALDAMAITRLATLLEPQAKADETYRVWQEILGPATSAIAQMERWGVGVDRGAIDATDAFLLVKQRESEARMFAYGTFDPDSPKQVGKFLYEDLHLPVVRRTEKGQASTDADSLEALRGKHPVVDDLLAWRAVATLRKTFAKGSNGDGGLYAHIRSDGRIHPTFNLDGARSGRLSCDSPNVQNIPRADTQEGKMIRDAFVAAPGHLLVEFDYSQLEIRIAALLSGDEKMKAIFKARQDFHQRTAETISQIAWGIAPADITSVHRTRAKAVNFGGMYGKTARTFAKEWGVPLEEAERIYSAILGEFSGYRTWSQRCLAEARKRGEVWTWWDGARARRRPLWRVADADDKARSVAEHGASNSPIQGTASDFCLRSLIEIVHWIKSDCVPAKLVLTVHDQLMLEVAEEAVREAVYTVRAIMCGWNSGDVPLEVDVKTGRTWGSLTKWKEAV